MILHHLQKEINKILRIPSEVMEPVKSWHQLSKSNSRKSAFKIHHFDDLNLFLFPKNVQILTLFAHSCSIEDKIHSRNQR